METFLALSVIQQNEQDVGCVLRRALFLRPGWRGIFITLGEEDIATPPETARQMHEKIPRSQLVIIPAAGHSSNVEQPEAVNDALRTFLRQ